MAAVGYLPLRETFSSVRRRCGLCTQQQGDGGSWSSSLSQWGKTVALRILQFYLTSTLCRQLMFICSAHLGLVKKHLVKLPLCVQCFTEWWQYLRGREDSITDMSRFILQTWLHHYSTVQHPGHLSGCFVRWWTVIILIVVCLHKHEGYLK